MRLFFLLTILGACADRAQDIACYSGGGLIWKGHAADVKYNPDGWIEFVDGNSGLTMNMRADCFLSDSDAK